MKEVKVKSNKVFAYENKILFDVIILGVISILVFWFPVATYVYKEHMYSIRGVRFLTGSIIMKGKVDIATNLWALLLIIIIVLIVINAMIFKKCNARMAGTIFFILSTAQFIVSIIFSRNVTDILQEAKGKEVVLGSGSILMVGLSILMLVRAFHVLFKNKVVVSLDFMALPGVLYFLINNYLPMFGIFIAFKKVDYSVGIWKSNWVGLNNFKYLFTTQDAWIMSRNTILYNLVFIVLGTVVGITIAIMIFEIISKTWQKIFQTTILLPQLISMIIVAYIVYAFLSNEAGFINKTFLGSENAIDFYARKMYWPFLLVLVYTWKMMGYNAIIYLSSITSIEKSLYEACKVDGATKMQQIFKITIPMLKPTIITLLIIQVGRIFYSDFGLFLQVPMNSGILFNVTQTIDTYVFRALMTSNQIGKASAASVYQSIVGFLVVIIVNGIVRKADKENAMF